MKRRSAVGYSLCFEMAPRERLVQTEQVTLPQKRSNFHCLIHSDQYLLPFVVMKIAMWLYLHFLFMFFPKNAYTEHIVLSHDLVRLPEHQMH